jgi:outer membrane protein OmpA-like peptidoglycan-associated protein
MGNGGNTLLLYFSDETHSEINDIYVSQNIGNNEWSVPESIGSTINLEDYDEISPFLAADGVTLYFASDRPGGQGKHDIWMSKRLDSTWKKWSEPVNLPAPINSPKWDAYFTMDAKADYAYLASSQNAVGGTDLVRIKLDESIMPKPVVIVYGRMINGATMQPVDSDVYYDVVGGTKDKSINATPVDGKYKMVLPYGTKYTLRVGSEEFMPLTDTLDLAVVGPFKEIYRDVYLNPVAVVNKMQSDSSAVVVRKNLDDVDLDTEVINEGEIINMNAVLFDYNKPILRSVSFKQIQKVISYMKQNPEVKIELSAHTDNVGSPRYNLLLSQDRAYAVAQYFIHGGITMNRIVPKGYGETNPIASNQNDDGKQQNRRVEFKIIKK